MITGKDVRKELKLAKDTIASDASIEQKLEAVRKVVEVNTKVTLSIRASLMKVMEKLGVEKIVSTRSENGEPSEE